MLVLSCLVSRLENPLFCTDVIIPRSDWERERKIHSVRGLAVGKEGLARSSSIGGSRRQIEAAMSPPRRPEGDAPPMYAKSPKLAQACLRNILICWCKSSKVCTFFRLR